MRCSSSAAWSADGVVFSLPASILPNSLTPWTLPTLKVSLPSNTGSLPPMPGGSARLSVTPTQPEVIRSLALTSLRITASPSVTALLTDSCRFRPATVTA